MTEPTKRPPRHMPPEYEVGKLLTTDFTPVALTEERIRQIVREELATYEKRKRQEARFGLPPGVETK